MLHDTPEGMKNVLEALLLSSSVPLSVGTLREAFEGRFSPEVLRRALEELQHDWRGRGLELVLVAEGWRFRTREAVQPYLARLLAEKPPRYSRTVMETLAVIAYRQPVTRGDIEQIRGVAVQAQTLRLLEERGWIREAGHRNVPGRPALLVTTSRFLSDLGLRSLDELPPLPEGESAESLPQTANLPFSSAEAGLATADDDGFAGAGGTAV